MTANSNVIARLTMTRVSGLRTIVEIRSDATFSDFYRFYRQLGARRSTKQLIRTANRNEGLLGRTERPGLDLIAHRLQMYAGETNPVVQTRIRIIKKRAYKRLISCTPDQLGMVHEKTWIPVAPRWERVYAQRIAA